MILAEKITPKHTALVVVDIQNDFCAPDGLLGRMGKDLSGMERLIDRLESLIARAEALGVPVLYTQQKYDRTKLNPLQKEQYDLDGKRITCDIAGDGYHFYRLHPAPENIFEKYNYNAFSNPAFGERLQKLGTKTLVITGVSTQYCVETAIRNGFDLGYKIVVPADVVGTTSNDPEIQNRTLSLVQKTYGVVTSHNEMLQVWKKPTPL